MNKEQMEHFEALEKIKDTLQECVGNEMRFKTNLGRCRVLERIGVLEEIYPNLFVIRITEDDDERCVSYTYADILTRIVELYDPKTDNDYFEWLN